MAAALLMAAATTSAAFASSPAGAEPADPTSLGQAIVGFEAGFLPATATVGGLEVLTVEPRLDYIVVAADDLRAVRAAMAHVPGVAYIEDDGIMTSFVVPNDSRYNQQYGPAMMGAHSAWDAVGWGSQSIKVAVLDTGIRASHQDLSANYIGGYDYVNNDNNPNDDCGHGTHVSGTVAAVTNNGIGVAGMSQASIIHHKVLGPVGGLFSITCSGSSSDINAAIMDAADEGAHIISMSLGGGGYSTSGNNAVNYAWNKGVLVVAASGNDSNNNDVSYPAAYDNAIAVGALTSSKTRASYSNGGAELEITAPGSNVESTYNGNDADYDSLSGTSMATPHVAGALALALSCDPTISHTQLRSLMQSTAEDLGSSGWDNIYGHGLMRIDSIVNAMNCGGGGGNNAPTASFGSTPSGLTVSFDGSASSDPDGDSLSYSWTFGDGNSGSGVSPSHTYASAGTYTVSLTVNDGNGGSDSHSASVTVTAPGGGGGCGAGFGDAELQDGVSESVSVSGWVYRQICVPNDATSITVSIDGPSCGLTGCSFDADLYTKDGSRAGSSNYDCRPYQSGSDESCTLGVAGGWVSIAIHAYSGSGTVTLLADHNGGAPPSNSPPTAAASGSCTDLACTFSASGSSDPDGDSLSYSWDFGDGNSGSGVSPSHTYTSAGTYTATVTVSDGNGGSDSASTTVTATAPNQAPTASFNSNPSDLTVSFDASASSDPDGDSLSYSWDFGDGNSGSGVSPTHTYASGGTYTVTLTVSDGNGGSDSASQSVTVTAPPAGCSGGANVAELDGSASVSVSSGQWTYRKVCVPAGASVLDIAMDGPGCGLFGCSFDADLYVKQSGLPSSGSYDCRPYQSGNDESCSFSNPTAGWYYVGIYGYSGSGTVTLSESN